MIPGVPHRPGGPVISLRAEGRSSYRLAGLLVLVLVVGSAFVASATAQDQPAFERPKSIRGTVVNALTGEPIGRALVFTPDNRFAQLTDGEGHFDYPLPKAEADDAGPVGMQLQSQTQFTFCCVQARKPGFLYTSNHREGTQIASGSDPVIALMPESLIKGRVSLPSSDPAAGVTVDLFTRQIQDGVFRWLNGPSVQTNSNGEFRFGELLPGEYKIVTHESLDTDPSTMASGHQLYGFPPVYYPGALDLTSASPVQLKAGQTFEASLSPVRQAYYPVRIPVEGEVANGLVTVSIQGHDSPGYSLRFLPDRHTISGFLPNGTYLVSMEAFQPNGASGAVTVTVSGGPSGGSPMVLSRHASVQLNVTEEFNMKDESRSGNWSDGKRTFELHGPRLDLQASLEPIGDSRLSGGRPIRPPAGQDDDALVIDDVAPGPYRLRTFASRGYVASATAGGVDLLEQPLIVSSGSNQPIDIHMRDDFAEIHGSLVNAALITRPVAAGARRSQAFVCLISQAGEPGQFLQFGTDEEGKFDVTTVAPGKYLALAFDTQVPDLPYRDVEAMKSYESKGRMVQLAPGQKETLELQIISGTD